MHQLSFWNGTYQTQSPTDQRIKTIHVNGVAPSGFLLLYFSGFVVVFSASLLAYPDAKLLQVAAGIWLVAGLLGAFSSHTNRKELERILQTVEPRKAVLKDGLISGDTCWEIVEQSNMDASIRDKHIWWTRYQNGLFSNQPADVFIYPLNGRIAIEDASNIVLVTVDAKKLIA